MSPAVIRGPCPWPGQDGDAAHRLLELQLFLGFLAVVGYLLAAGYADRQRAEEALRQSEERFRSIFNNASEGVLFTGLDGSVFAANRTACHMLGRSEQELREEGRNAVVDVTDPRLPQALEERTRTGQFRGELNFRRKDGTVFPVELSSNAFAFGTRQTRACIIFRDVSERKRTEAALCKKNAELEAALTQVNTLSGLIPICAGCKKIRDDKNFWHQVESYISQHSDARFTHSLCPDCTKKFYPELEEAPPV